MTTFTQPVEQEIIPLKYDNRKFFMSWKKHSHTFALKGGNSYSIIGPPLKDSDVLNPLQPGDLVVLGSLSTQEIFAIVTIEDRYSLPEARRIEIADAIWPSGLYIATHKTTPLWINKKGITIDKDRHKNLLKVERKRKEKDPETGEQVVTGTYVRSEYRIGETVNITGFNQTLFYLRDGKYQNILEDLRK